ncbi:MAG: pantetheine-phosphate adenylyltransferase [Candidatus Micrarchaeota archaeon]
MKKISFACTGGTFDRTHKGHEALLRKAFSVADKVLIGLTSDRMVRRTKKFFEIVKPYPKRKEELLSFLKKNGFAKRAAIVELNDVCGPVISKTNKCDCIVTSRKTLAGAREINKRRKKNKLNPLPIILVKTVETQDERPISSTRVRQGQIDRKGTVFEKAFAKTLSLTPETTRVMKKPFGKTVPAARVFSELKKLKPFKTIIVGDASAMIFEKAPSSLKPSVVAVDGRIERKKISFKPGNHFDRVYSVSNRHGTITPKAAKLMEKAVEAKNHDRILINVKGEEDLLTLPAVLFAPLESVVCYGQPNKGMVLVEVSEEKKKQAFSIANKMKRVG